jgi:D-sedoheptulose 7-phosphate isomerase
MIDENTAIERAIARVIEDSIETRTHLLDRVGDIAAVANVLVNAFSQGKQLLLFGNGGSAADAQHIAAEFVGRFYVDRRPLPALALNVNASVMTAIGNDYSFDHIFARQVEAFGSAGDVALGVSTSGNSKNVLEGLRCAHALGLTTIGMTGLDSGALGRLECVDYCLTAPTDDTPRVQECHMLIGHALCLAVENALFGRE